MSAQMCACSDPSPTIQSITVKYSCLHRGPALLEQVTPCCSPRCILMSFILWQKQRSSCVSPHTMCTILSASTYEYLGKALVHQVLPYRQKCLHSTAYIQSYKDLYIALCPHKWHRVNAWLFGEGGHLWGDVYGTMWIPKRPVMCVQVGTLHKDTIHRNTNENLEK